MSLFGLYSESFLLKVAESNALELRVRPEPRPASEAASSNSWLLPILFPRICNDPSGDLVVFIKGRLSTEDWGDLVPP